MSFDIYGNNLRLGHCEVHPHVHEEYPCSVCLAESASRRDTHSRADICDGNPSRCESAHMLGQAQEEIDRLKAVLSGGRHLAPDHTGMKISAEGILGRIRDGRYFRELDYGCGVMLGHLQNMAKRFYAGDIKAADEFLQLYDLADDRPRGDKK